MGRFADVNRSAGGIETAYRYIWKVFVVIGNWQLEMAVLQRHIYIFERVPLLAPNTCRRSPPERRHVRYDSQVMSLSAIKFGSILHSQ